MLSLAQAQLRRGNPEPARRTLESLRRPYVNPVVRSDAEELLRKMGHR